MLWCFRNIERRILQLVLSFADTRKQVFTRNRLVCHENKNPTFMKLNSFGTKTSVDRVSCQLKFNASESNSFK